MGRAENLKYIWRRGYEFLKEIQNSSNTSDLFEQPYPSLETLKCILKKDKVKDNNKGNNFPAFLDPGYVVTLAQDGDTIVAYAVIWRGRKKLRETSSELKQVSIVLAAAVLTDYNEDNERKYILKKLLAPAWGIADEYVWGCISNDAMVQSLLSEITHRSPDHQIQIEHESRLDILVRSLYPDAGETTSVFIFNDQAPFLTEEENKNFWNTTNEENQNAYEDMDMGSGSHKWADSTSDEMDYIERKIRQQLKGKLTYDFAYDIGCGTGRHSMELAARGFENVIGIDYGKANIDAADAFKEKGQAEYKNVVTFEEADARDYLSDRKADLVICLFDVICSFSDDSMNQKIIKTVYNLCKPGGYAVFSAMNYNATPVYNTFDSERDSFSRLYQVPVSTIMGTTGNVFDPEYCLINEEEHLVYRRERFEPKDRSLPYVRNVVDRRYTKDELERILIKAGFVAIDQKMNSHMYISVRSKGFKKEMSEETGKEIVAICRKI